MAVEARRNGGRDIPLTSDEWRPKHRHYKRRFGLVVYWIPRCCRLERGYVRWYLTPEGREQGRAKMLKDKYLRVVRTENVER